MLVLNYSRNITAVTIAPHPSKILCAGGEVGDGTSLTLRDVAPRNVSSREEIPGAPGGFNCDVGSGLAPIANTKSNPTYFFTTVNVTCDGYCAE